MLQKLDSKKYALVVQDEFKDAKSPEFNLDKITLYYTPGVDKGEFAEVNYTKGTTQWFDTDEEAWVQSGDVLRENNAKAGPSPFALGWVQTYEG